MTDAPTFTWAFSHWEVSAVPVNEFSGVILSVGWQLHATLGKQEKIVHGVATLAPPAVGSTTFIPKDKITEADLIAMVKPVMDYDGYVANLTAHLMQQKPIIEVPQFAS